MTGEYGVLSGAEALAVPTRLGQKMIVKDSKGSNLIWESLDHQGETWFSATISLYDFKALKTSDEIIADKLKGFLKNACRLNSEFLSKWNGFKVETQLEFDRNWGLGSSSSLLYMIAEWADVNGIMLALKATNGSGYDVACAGADGPIVYISNDEQISYTGVDFYPSFADQLYFIHLGNKVRSEDQVKYYIRTCKNKDAFAKAQTELTHQFIECKSLSKFDELIEAHENLVSESLKLTKVKDEHFKDYWGSIKSLGAWGGDLVMATSSKSEQETKSYFEAKGYSCMPYQELVLEEELVS